MGQSILWITDFPVIGSGYATISKPICNGLVDKGFKVRMLAISNNGEEHWNKFSLIPINPLQELQAAIPNLLKLDKPDIVVIALDIPLAGQIHKQIKDDEGSKGIKYILITPMENGPLMPSWAVSLNEFDKVFFISKLGEVEAQKAGVASAEHLIVGLSEEWYPAREDEKEKVRKNLGFEPDEKVILTVADNSERKNFDASFKMVSLYKKQHPDIKIKYVLVTRENSIAGWNVMELAFQYGIQNEFVLFERGMPESRLRLLYISADAFLLTSKAEGLGLPIMEALSCGLPCVATSTGAITNLLRDGIGWLIPPEYTIEHDVWGHSRRHFADTEVGVMLLHDALHTTSKVIAKYPIDTMIDQVARACDG